MEPREYPPSLSPSAPTTGSSGLRRDSNVRERRARSTATIARRRARSVFGWRSSRGRSGADSCRSRAPLVCVVRAQRQRRQVFRVVPTGRALVRDGAAPSRTAQARRRERAASPRACPASRAAAAPAGRRSSGSLRAPRPLAYGCRRVARHASPRERRLREGPRAWERWARAASPSPPFASAGGTFRTSVHKLCRVLHFECICVSSAIEVSSCCTREPGRGGRQRSRVRLRPPSSSHRRRSCWSEGMSCSRPRAASARDRRSRQPRGAVPCRSARCRRAPQVVVTAAGAGADSGTIFSSPFGLWREISGSSRIVVSERTSLFRSTRQRPDLRARARASASSRPARRGTRSSPWVSVDALDHARDR